MEVVEENHWRKRYHPEWGTEEILDCLGTSISLHVAAVRDLPTVVESDGGRSWKASMQSEVLAVYSQARGKE